jgi:hypothetical protein
MGLDMWLPSVFDFDDEKAVDVVLGDFPPFERDIDNIQKAVVGMYDRLRATGGYYREAYSGNPGACTMLRLWGAIEGKRILPADEARAMLADVEQKPITPALVDDAVELSGKCSASPLPTREQLETHLTKQRDCLMALLRKAVELNEPLHISQ